LGGKSLVSVSGQFVFEKETPMDLTLRFERCPVEPFLGEAARTKFSATFAGETRVQKQLATEEPAATSGELTFTGAVVKNVDGLEKIAAFTGKREFSRLTLESCKAKYRSEGQKLTIEDLSVEARGLMRVEGSCVVREETINGTFKLGVSADVLNSFPGAREEVFTTQRGGYFWTTVKVSGPMKKPREDLKARLIVAAEKHFAKKLLAPILKPGREVVEKLRALF
jgi:hypothetical protein